MNRLIKHLDIHFANKSTNLKKFIPIFEKHFKIEDFTDTRIIPIPRNKYIRRKIYHNSNYEIVQIYWGENSATTIHEHPPQGCLYKILNGKLLEEIYDNNKKKIANVKIFSGDLKYIDNTVGLHKVYNKGYKTHSLHIYAPPYNKYLYNK